jgi:transcriptional antiterminator Rof (Rho-off)
MLNLYQTTTLLLEIDNIRTLSANTKKISQMQEYLITEQTKNHQQLETDQKIQY